MRFKPPITLTAKVIARFEAFVVRAPFGGCWDWRGCKMSAGYGRIYVAGTVHSAHRVSWLIHKGPIPPRLYVLHQCDQPACTNPEHLFLGTCKDNVQDSVKKGRAIRSPGEHNGQAKLTAATVLKIRSEYKPFKVTKKMLARRYGVSEPAIVDIIRRHTWRHL